MTSCFVSEEVYGWMAVVLKKYILPSFELRIKTDLICAYKLMCGLVCLDPGAFMDSGLNLSEA